MKHKVAQLDLTESNARYILLALRELNEKLQVLSLDESIEEDERFFYANDLMESSRTYDKLKNECVNVFGDDIIVHNNDVL